jgi:NAD-dependent SIR2 family protein deacetylase
MAAMTMSSPGSDLQQAAAWLRAADGLLITAGAGMGIDSGLPDFRGPGGFWAAYPALGRARIAFESIANPAAFASDPALAWGFYGHRLDLYRRTEPHAGFRLLLGMAAEKPHGAWVFTSNVDGQFAKAGFAAGRICEIHGSIHHLPKKSLYVKNSFLNNRLPESYLLLHRSHDNRYVRIQNPHVH